MIPKGEVTVPSPFTHISDVMDAAALGKDELVHWIERNGKPDGVVSPDVAYGQHELIKQAWDMFHQLPSLNTSLDSALASKKQLAAQVKAARDIQEKKRSTFPAEKASELMSRLEKWQLEKMNDSEEAVNKATSSLTSTCDKLDTILQQILSNLELVAQGSLPADPAVVVFVDELDQLFSQLAINSPPKAQQVEAPCPVVARKLSFGQPDDALPKQVPSPPNQEQDPMEVDVQQAIFSVGGWNGRTFYGMLQSIYI